MANMIGKQTLALLKFRDEFLKHPITSNEGIEEDFESFDNRRVAAIPVIQKLVSEFINGGITLQAFKEKHETMCRE